MAVRLALMADHYRTDRPWTDDLRKAGRAAAGTVACGGRGAGRPGRRAPVGELRAALADDLDTPARWRRWTPGRRVRSPVEGDDPEAPALVRDSVDALLGVRL